MERCLICLTPPNPLMQFPNMHILFQPAPFPGPGAQLLSFYFKALLRLFPHLGSPLHLLKSSL